MSTEIEYTTEVVLKLGPLGNVSNAYITAEEQQFPSQQRQDVMFSQFSGRYRNAAISI
jgi:hypothetical protein